VTKNIGIAFLLIAVVCLIYSFSVSDVPSYMRYSYSQAEIMGMNMAAQMKRVLGFSASGFFLTLGAVLTAVGVNAEKIIAQNATIIRLLKEGNAEAMPDGEAASPVEGALEQAMEPAAESAIGQCPQCGKDVSQQAAKCIHCNATLKRGEYA